MAEKIKPKFDRLLIACDAVFHRANNKKFSISLRFSVPSFPGRVAEKHGNPVEMKYDEGALKEMLHNIHMDTLDRYKVAEVKKFLRENIDHRFSRKEFRTLFKKITGKSLARPRVWNPPTRRVNLEEFAFEIENPRIDLTKPWDLADVAICAKNSQGRLLYTNRMVMNTLSTNFKHCPFGPVKGSEIMETTVSAEFTTMKEILSVIHHCDTNYRGPSRVLHPALLHSMYCAASKDQLDIPMIRDLCVAELLKQKSVDSWEVLLNLHISTNSAKGYLLPFEQCREWIFRDDEHLSYRKGDKIVVISSCQGDPVLLSDSVLKLIDVL